MILAIKEAGLTQIIYYAFFCIGFLVTYIFLFWYGKRINLQTAQMIIAVILGSVGVLSVMGLLQIILTPLANVVPIMNSYLNNMGRGFIFVPLIALAVSAIIKVSWEKLCNLYSFTQTIIWGSASLGCLFAGCCRGYPCEWGIYNIIMEKRLFPTQLLNSLALLSVAVYIYARCKKRGFIPDGKEYPIVLILVGTIRFSTEFLMDNKKIVFGLSSLSFDAMIMLIVGIVMLVIINHKERVLTKSTLKSFTE